MRLDSVHLTIRQRTLLECLDLAFLVCGRHFLGLAIAAMIGIIPVYWINTTLFENVEVPFAWMIIIGMELPFVTLPITVFMGQITFSQRFSTSQALRTVWGSLLSLFLFQGLLRLVCLFFFILSPMVFIGMYYLNPIILLERPSLGRVWSRRSAMNKRNLGRIIGLASIDLLIQIVGTLMFSIVLRAVASLWEDRFSWELMILGGLNGDSFEPGWEEQISFWLVMSFLTVFRFITYLDCRIRREGWDVDLKIRRETATYAGREVA